MSLLLGLIAALAWGIHDLCVRYVSQRTSVPAAILTVLCVGAALVLPFAVLSSEWSNMTPLAYILSTASGIAFTIAGLALYYAFAIGPVRLVAPIIGAYPILSVAWAAANGSDIPWTQWTAVLVIIAGVGFIAKATDADDSSPNPKAAILWSILAATGFATTFALGQEATTHGAEFPSLLVIRLIAILSLLLIALAIRADLRPARTHLPILATMGLLDAIALGAVVLAAGFAKPELASVASSIFGMITVILAWAFLKERMSPTQWAAVSVVFAAILYLATN